PESALYSSEGRCSGRSGPTPPGRSGRPAANHLCRQALVVFYEIPEQTKNLGDSNEGRGRILARRPSCALFGFTPPRKWLEFSCRQRFRNPERDAEGARVEPDGAQRKRERDGSIQLFRP